MHKTASWLRSLVVIVAVVVLLTVLLFFAYRFYLRMAYPLKYQDTIAQYATQFEISESLVYGVIHTESHFNVDAQSYAGAKGLMQITDTTFDWVLKLQGETTGDVFDADTNIRCGVRILQYLYGQLDDTETVLAAYNAGIGNVNKWLADEAYSNDGKTLHTIPFSETRAYVKIVLKAQKMYQTLYDIP